MARMNRPKNRHISPRAWSWRSSSSSSYRPCRMPRKTFRMPASTTRLSAAIRYRNVAASEVPMTPPRVSYPDFGSTMAPKTARAAMASPAPATMMMQECPRAKKNPVPSGRRPSAVGLRVVLSIAEMWSASKACRAPRVDAVSATPRPSPRPLNWKWCGAIAKAKMPQPPRFRVRTTRAMALSRPVRFRSACRGSRAAGRSIRTLCQCLLYEGRPEWIVLMTLANLVMNYRMRLSREPPMTASAGSGKP